MESTSQTLETRLGFADQAHAEFIFERQSPAGRKLRTQQLKVIARGSLIAGILTGICMMFASHRQYDGSAIWAGALGGFCLLWFFVLTLPWLIHWNKNDAWILNADEFIYTKSNKTRRICWEEIEKFRLSTHEFEAIINGWRTRMPLPDMIGKQNAAYAFIMKRMSNRLDYNQRQSLAVQESLHLTRISLNTYILGLIIAAAYNYIAPSLGFRQNESFIEGLMAATMFWTMLFVASCVCIRWRPCVKRP